MKSSKITNDTELRVWCVQQCTDINGGFNLKKAKVLYAFVSASMGESMAVQTRPHVHFFSRLRNWLK